MPAEQPQERADLIFTDPPYNVPIDGHVCGLGRVRHREFAMGIGEMSKETFTAFLRGIGPRSSMCWMARNLIRRQACSKRHVNMTISLEAGTAAAEIEAIRIEKPLYNQQPPCRRQAADRTGKGGQSFLAPVGGGAPARRGAWGRRRTTPRSACSSGDRSASSRP